MQDVLDGVRNKTDESKRVKQKPAALRAIQPSRNLSRQLQAPQTTRRTTHREITSVPIFRSSNALARRCAAAVIIVEGANSASLACTKICSHPRPLSKKSFVFFVAEQEETAASRY